MVGCKTRFMHLFMHHCFHLDRESSSNLQVIQPSLPVIEDDVGSPHITAGYSNCIQAIVILLLPGEVGIHPYLPDPQVRGQDLVALVLVR